jgi:hypothetical protein
MLGCYDFCGYYEWTFAWLEAEGGPDLVRRYWDEGIHQDSQQHARALILGKGFAGMSEYWGHTLAEESPQRGYQITERPGLFRVDMHQCPSKGFLLRNGLEQYSDYCDHCMGWIGPLMKEAGFVIDHEHNHRGQCWWELRAAGDPAPSSAPGSVAGSADVRGRVEWQASESPIDRYLRATGPEHKSPAPQV